MTTEIRSLKFRLEPGMWLLSMSLDSQVSGPRKQVFNWVIRTALVGQGEPGDILRNLLLEAHRADKEKGSGLWQELANDVEHLFGYRLKEPQYSEATNPFIRIEYSQGKDRSHIDTALPLAAGFIRC